MSEIKGLFEKVKIENLMAFLVYGTDSEGESIDDYEEKLEGSYDSFLSGLERKYPGIDRNDNELMDMISDFAGAHDHVYFEAGALTGFRLCRNMDRGRASATAVPTPSPLWMAMAVPSTLEAYTSGGVALPTIIDPINISSSVAPIMIPAWKSPRISPTMGAVNNGLPIMDAPNVYSSMAARKATIDTSIA